jgi:hypothetical protein
MITPPNWAKDATPTTRGWVKNGELLKSQKISESEIAEYMGTSKPVYLSEAPSHKPYYDMSEQEVTQVVSELHADDGLSFDRGTVVTNAPDGGKGKPKGTFAKIKNFLSE